MKICSWLASPNMETSVEKWEGQQGIAFLTKIGVGPGQAVLDFGCSVGHYTIPAAKAVGQHGVVYAVDKQEYALHQLQRKAALHKLTNIKTMKTSGQTDLALQDGTIDVALLYDVLHYLEQAERNKLYREMFRVLRPTGLLSVYPKHTIGDFPIMAFKSLHLNDVREEIRRSGFRFEVKQCGSISHDDGLNTGCVLNFRKSTT